MTRKEMLDFLAANGQPSVPAVPGKDWRTRVYDWEDRVVRRSEDAALYRAVLKAKRLEEGYSR